MPLFGLDTEYGIAVEGKGAADLLAESREVVKAYRGQSAGTWNYANEDPRNDMRGFHVDKLSQDPDDAQFDDPDAAPLPHHVERADRVLENGGRFYNDHGHPEYATPECATLHDLVAHDRAGDLIVWRAAKTRMEILGAQTVQIYKNNTDFHNSSYGTHENYLLSRDIPFDILLRSLLPFFATRMLFAGAGKIGIEPSGDKGVFQLSQRADFVSEEASVDTLFRRPLFNTRDEPHTDARRWRRLHVICGDSNMMEYATALKVGTTYVVLQLLENGWTPPIQLTNPVQAVREISRDTSLRWLVDVDGVGKTPSVEVQRVYLAEAKKQFVNPGADTKWVLSEWESTLDTLDTDPLTLTDRLDWVAKRDLLTQFAESESLRMDNEILRSLDLAYSSVDPDDGLYHGLEQNKQVVRILDENAIEDAVTAAPRTTRAKLRGDLISRFPTNIGSVGWNRVVLRDNGQSWLVDLDDYVTPESVRDIVAKLDESKDLDTFIRLIAKK